MVITHDQFKEIVGHLPEHAADLVITAYWTGMRRSEVFNLGWDKVSFEDDGIYLEAEAIKIKTARFVPFLSDEIREVFYRRREQTTFNGKNPVFTYEGRQLRSIRTSFKKACAGKPECPTCAFTI